MTLGHRKNSAGYKAAEIRLQVHNSAGHNSTKCVSFAALSLITLHQVFINIIIFRTIEVVTTIIN